MWKHSYEKFAGEPVDLVRRMDDLAQQFDIMTVQHVGIDGDDRHTWLIFMRCISR